MKTLRLAACNLQTGIGTTKGYWQYLTTGWKYFFPHDSVPIEEAAAFLREDQVDVAALCEVEGGSRRTRGIDQVDLLTQRTPLEHRAFFPTLTAGERVNQGNAVCSRFPLQHVANHALPSPGEPRFLSEADMDVDGRTVRVFVTHLSLKRKVRRPQIDHLLEVVHPSTGPTILAGDFNISEAAELELITEGHLQQVDTLPTFPAWHPTKHLDHLFVSEHFTIGERYAFDRFRFADHLPLVADVHLA